MTRIPAFLMLPLILTACGTWTEYSENRDFTAPMAYTTADVRIIMQRNDHLGHHLITCTEPSPDVAKAISTIAAIQAQIRGNGGNAAVGSQQALAELAGRSTALLGLRDGLFRACEAYANGAIGDDAYALIISRYGQLVTTLFLGQDAAGAGSNADLARIASQVLTAPISNSAGTGDNSGTIGSGTSPRSSATTLKTGNAASPASATILAAWTLGAQGPTPIAAQNETRGNAVAKTTSAIPPTNTNPTKGTTNTGSSQPSDTAGLNPNAGAQAAASIEAMQRNYLNLDQNPLGFLHLLFIACTNEYDQTRGDMHAVLPIGATTQSPSAPAQTHVAQRPTSPANPFLEKLCDGMSRGELMAAIEKLVPLTKQLEPPTSTGATSSTIQRQATQSSTRHISVGNSS